MLLFLDWWAFSPIVFEPDNLKKKQSEKSCKIINLIFSGYIEQECSHFNVFYDWSLTLCQVVIRVLLESPFSWYCYTYRDFLKDFQILWAHFGCQLSMRLQGCRQCRASSGFFYGTLSRVSLNLCKFLV